MRAPRARLPPTIDRPIDLAHAIFSRIPRPSPRAPRSQTRSLERATCYNLWVHHASDRIWGPAERRAAWGDLERRWDLLIVGGGITGAGLACEAARLGLKVLLVEARDFASGTSSRSSKMVHGGARYLANLQFGTTLTAVRERDRLLREASGLVSPLEYIFPHYTDDRRFALGLRVGLWLYDRFSATHAVHSLGPAALRRRFPGLRDTALRGAWSYVDAETDDARLVLRVLREAASHGATILNYTEARNLYRDHGRVAGVTLYDHVDGREATPKARVVVNATGVWADELRADLGLPPKMRPLRGSHLVLAHDRLPVSAALLLRSRDDDRVLYIYPWEGATVVGTTDLDHAGDLADEPRITAAEVDYLLRVVHHSFPKAAIGPADILSTFAGIRPVIAQGSEDPSKEPRDHAIWHEDGLWTVTGGKLTTFREIARETLQKLRYELPELPQWPPRTPLLRPPPAALGRRLAAAFGDHATPARSLRLLGRYGVDTAGLLDTAAPGDLTEIPGTTFLWAELRWAARAEAVVHLDDLLLRRTRLGLLVADGGAALFPRLQALCAAELAWDDARWAAEAAAYRARWRQAYSLPPGVPPTIPPTSPVPAPWTEA